MTQVCCHKVFMMFFSGKQKQPQLLQKRSSPVCDLMEPVNKELQPH